MGVKKPLCPFYGFRSWWGVQEKSKNPHYCALMYRACLRTMQGKKANQEKCRYNIKDFQEELKPFLTKVRVYSPEFSKNGISLEDWIDTFVKQKKAG